MTQTPQTINLPEPDGSLVTRAVTDRLIDDQRGTIVWVTGEPNPMAPATQIVRMYATAPIVDDGETASPGRELRVYSVSTSKIVRHTISPQHVRLIEEGLDLDVFLSEIHVEEGIEEDEDEAESSADSNGTQPSTPDAIS